MARRDACDLAWVVVGGLLAAVLGERVTRAFGWWSYSDRMPLVPGLDVGVAPLVQRAVLTVVTFDLARHVAPRTPRSWGPHGSSWLSACGSPTYLDPTRPSKAALHGRGGRPQPASR